MKLIITLIFCYGLVPCVLSGQGFAGRKILTTLLGLMHGISKSDFRYTNGQVVERQDKTNELSGEVLYGRVNAKGILFAYGLSGATLFTKSYENGVPTGKQRYGTPYVTMMLQKFTQFMPSIYYSPSAKMSLGYNHYNNVTTYRANVTGQPLSLAFSVTSRINLITAFGRIAFAYTHDRTGHNEAAPDASYRGNNLSVTATMAAYDVAVQFIL